MDIRRFFTSPKTLNNQPSAKLSDNNESKPVKTSSKKRRIIESDSDEDPLPQNDKGSKKVSPKGKSKQKVHNSPKEKQKEVSVADFFGSAPINRAKEKHPTGETKMKEKHVHEDKDFEATLTQLKSATETKVEKVKVNGKSDSKASTKKEKSPSVKRKSKSLIKVEVTPSEKSSVKVEVKEEKPPAKRHKGGGASYASYLAREGPRSLGCKEIPEGEDDCLAGLTFVITGILESLERDEAKSLVEKYGGKVMTNISSNTKYVVIGRDAGASKLEKAEKFNTKVLDEDGLLNLIGTMPGNKKTPKSKKDKSDKKLSPVSKTTPIKHSEKTESPEKLKKSFKIEEDSDFQVTNLTDNKKSESGDRKLSIKDLSPEKMDKSSAQEKKISTESTSTMFVDKYKPTSLKQLIGQQGEKSNAKKLLHWLVNWHRNRKLNRKAIPGRFNPSDDGGGFKAALLSGPPGVGKTTTAQLVCKETNFDLFELNASDTRSKKSLQQMVSQLLGNQTLAGCLKEGGKVSRNHVIVMDEVDGMAGNEDRGGMMELIGFIKSSKVPVLCICNDRNHQKIRSLANYCFDLRFQRPRVEQIKAAMMSIAFKEHIKVTPDVLQDVIVASNQDVRQVLHNMSMWSANSNCLTKDQTKSDIGKGTKHIKMSPFDVLREVFAIGNNPKATVMDKSDLFFHDYSLAPLFVQENYIYVIPKAAQGDKKKHMTLLCEAADSICVGDIIDRQIRSQSSWSLLPTQAIFASVVPGELLHGNLQQMISFPLWLGKNSNRNHMDRVLQELHVHMRMKITGNKTDVALDYLPLLKRALTEPLIKKEQDGIPEVLRTMEDYYLLREDFDSIIELSTWSKQVDPRTKIITKVKSSFTRAYNKESGKNPYTVTNVKKKKGSTKEAEGESLVEDEIEESDEGEDDNIEKDAMIKVKKATKKDSTDQNKPSTSKEKKKNQPKKGKTK